MCGTLSLHPTAPVCAPRVCRSPWSPAVMRVAGHPGVLCSWCRACGVCVSVCFTDISVRHCVRCRIRRVCTRRTAVCLMLRRRRLRRLRCRSFDRSWYGGWCTVSVSAVLSVVLPVFSLSLFSHYSLPRNLSHSSSPASTTVTPDSADLHAVRRVWSIVLISVFSRRSAMHRSQQQQRQPACPR